MASLTSAFQGPRGYDMDDSTVSFDLGSNTNSNLQDITPFQSSCGKHKKFAGTLTGTEIQKYEILSYSDGTKIPDEEFQATTFDLRLGDGHYLYDENIDDRKWQPYYIGPKELSSLNNGKDEPFARPRSDDPRTLVIPPFGSALIELYETVDTLSVADKENILLVGRFDLKLSNVHQGLISQQATQVEPCYKGKLFCFLHNLSNTAIFLEHKKKIATIEFSYVSCLHDEEKCKMIIEDLKVQNAKRYEREYCDTHGITDIRYFFYAKKLPKDCGLLSLKKKMEDAVQSPEAIEAIAKKVKQKMERTGKIVSTGISALTAILIALCGHFWNQDNLRKELKEELTKFEEKYDKKIDKTLDSLEKIIKTRTISASNDRINSDSPPSSARTSAPMQSGNVETDTNKEEKP